MYSLSKMEHQAELLWLRLQGRVYKAYCDGDHTLASRLETLSERAFWRLIRRMDMSNRLRRAEHQLAKRTKLQRHARRAHG